MNAKLLDPETAEAIRQRFLKVDAATVSDVLDRLGYQHQGLAGTFAPYPETAGKLAGWAYTLCGEMRPYAGGGDPDKMKAVDGLKPGCVSVWSGQGDGVCFFGELIALGMKTRGSTGALVDGGIRDIEWIAKQKFPVYARYRTPVQSIGRWKVTAWQVPAYLPGATKQHVIVNPGDFVLGDVNMSGIAAGATATATLTVPSFPQLPAGQYYIAAKIEKFIPSQPAGRRLEP